MERFHCLKACPVDTLEWNESDDDESTAGGSDSDSSSDSDSADAEGEQEGVEYTGGDESDDELSAALLDAPTADLEALRLAKAERDELRRKATAFIGVSKDAARTEADVLSTPLPGESLKVFYERSKSHWAAKAYGASAGEARGKEMRTEGFALAQNAYTEYEPILKEVSQPASEPERVGCMRSLTTNSPHALADRTHPGRGRPRCRGTQGCKGGRHCGWWCGSRQP